MINCRQGLLLSVPHYFGQLTIFSKIEPTKERTFLVVDIDDNSNEIVLISITSQKIEKGKSMNLFRKGHISFYPHHPPF